MPMRGLRACSRSLVPKGWRGSPLALLYALIFFLSFVPPVVELTLVQAGLARRVPSAAVTPWAPVMVTRVFEPSPLRVGDVLLSVDGVPLDVDHFPLLARGSTIAVGEAFRLGVLRDGESLRVEAPAIAPRFSREQWPYGVLAVAALAVAFVLLFLVPPSVTALPALLLTPFVGGAIGAVAANPLPWAMSDAGVVAFKFALGPMVAGTWMFGLYQPFPLPRYRLWRDAWRWLVAGGLILSGVVFALADRWNTESQQGLALSLGLAVLGVAGTAGTMVWRLRLRPPPSVRRQLLALLWALASAAVGGACLTLTNSAFALGPPGSEAWFALAGAVLMVPMFPAMLALCFDLSIRSLRRLLARFALWVTSGVAALIVAAALWGLSPVLGRIGLGVAPLLGAGAATAALVVLWHRWLGGVLERRLVRQEPDSREREQVLTGLVHLVGRSGLEGAAAEVASTVRELLGCRWVHVYAPAPSGGPLPWVPLATATAAAPRSSAATPLEPTPGFESVEALERGLGGEATRFVIPLRGPNGALAALAGELDASIRRFPTMHPDERSALELFAGRAGATLAMGEQGRRVGPYRLTHHLASGGMGEVYVAEDTRVDAAHPVVVLKRLLPALVGSEAHVDRFLAEAEVAKSLDHPGIVETYEAGRDANGLLYIAMEYVQGGDVRGLLAHCRATGGPLDADLAFAIGARLCDALAYAHGTATGTRRAKPLVHRDISPDNVLLSSAGTVKLADFGVALELDPHGAGQAEMGKVPFMAPERLDGLGATPRSDLFGVGVLLYELLTLTHPFAQSTRAATLEAIRLGRPIPLSALRDDVPSEPLELVMAALRADPAARPPTAQAMATLLDRFAAAPADAEKRLARLAGQLWSERGATTLSGSSTSGSHPHPHPHPHADAAEPTKALEPPPSV